MKTTAKIFLGVLVLNLFFLIGCSDDQITGEAIVEISENESKSALDMGIGVGDEERNEPNEEIKIEEITDTMETGVIKEYELNGKKYQIKPSAVDGMAAFLINDKMTKSVSEGGSLEFEDIEISVNKISEKQAIGEDIGQQVEFSFESDVPYFGKDNIFEALKEGEEKEIKVFNKTFNIKAVVISRKDDKNFVVFLIDDKLTKKLNQGDTKRAPNYKLKVNNILYNEPTRFVDSYLIDVIIRSK